MIQREILNRAAWSSRRPVIDAAGDRTIPNGAVCGLHTALLSSSPREESPDDTDDTCTVLSDYVFVSQRRAAFAFSSIAISIGSLETAARTADLGTTQSLRTAIYWITCLSVYPKHLQLGDLICKVSQGRTNREISYLQKSLFPSPPSWQPFAQNSTKLILPLVLLSLMQKKSELSTWLESWLWPAAIKAASIWS